MSSQLNSVATFMVSANRISFIVYITCILLGIFGTLEHLRFWILIYFGSGWVQVVSPNTPFFFWDDWSLFRSDHHAKHPIPSNWTIDHNSAPTGGPRQGRSWRWDQRSRCYRAPLILQFNIMLKIVALVLCLVFTKLGDKDECAIWYWDGGITANFPR